MRTFLKIIGILILLLCVGAVLAGCLLYNRVKDPEFEYQPNSDGYTLVGLSKEYVESINNLALPFPVYLHLNIPSHTPDGDPVTIVDPQAFWGVCYYAPSAITGEPKVKSGMVIRSVKIPGTVKTVTPTGGYFPYYNFQNGSFQIECKGCPDYLKKVTIEEGVEYIDAGGFGNYKNLKSLNIPKSATHIVGSHELPDGVCRKYKNGLYLTRGSNPYAVFAGILDPESVTEIELNEKTEFIAARAFSGSGITEITVPDQVEVLSYEAFSGCALTSVRIGKGVKNIHSYAFSCGIPIESPNSAIRYTASLTEITVDEANPYFKSIDGNLYSKDGTELLKYADGKSDTTFTVPSGVTTIYSNVFGGYLIPTSHLTSIVIPSSVTDIMSNAFNSCLNLETIYCEAERKPDGFYDGWNTRDYGNTTIPVTWGYKEN